MQRDDRPAALVRDALQRVVRIDRDRVRHAFQQRHIVERIAVEPALGEAGEGFAERGEPRVQPLDLAFTPPVKAPSRTSGSVAMRCAMPNSCAMGEVTNELVAVTIAHRLSEDR